VGFLGALTTFSSFAFDAATLIDKQGLWMSILYIGVSVCLSLAAFAAAHFSAGSLLARLST
jgi:fluoride ion exporter CrcB/FEX